MTTTAAWSWSQCPEPGCHELATSTPQPVTYCCHGDAIHMSRVTCAAKHHFLMPSDQLALAGPQMDGEPR
jgi:hypothetical protein